MTKRKHSDGTYTVDDLFNRIFAAVGKMDNPPQDIPTFLKQLKSTVLSDLSAAGGKEVTKAATEFTIDETVEIFGLKYTEVASAKAHAWRIENFPEAMNFEITPCIGDVVCNVAQLCNHD